MTQDTQALEPVVTPSGEGEALWWFGGLAEVKVTGEQTGGQLTILEITEPPHMEAPLHVHHREDEGFWILEGSATFEIGDTTVEAGPGDFLWGPRNIPHRYTAGPSGCKLLFIMTPGGFEGLVRDMGVPAEARTLPPADEGEEPDWEMVARVAKEHGCALVGTP